ncbi:MAG: glycosyltransferase family 4 protein [Desulfobacterales bacterium]|nr:glycosyltransferase family 4 protein [Desulfobacterales bacterium]
MKVLCVTGHSDRPEAETFIGLRKLGVDLQVFCPAEAPHYRRLAQAGVPVADLAPKGRFDRAVIARLRQTLIEEKIDVLHLFNNRAVSNGIMAAARLPVKIVVYRGIVGNVSFFNPASWMTYLHPRVDRIVCVAEAVRQYFLKMKLLWLHVPPDKPVTIYKGHHLAWYTAPPADLKQFGIPEGAFVVCCTANFRPRKGLRFLMEATHLLHEIDACHLLLIGKMNAASLSKQIGKSPMKDRIHLAGFRRDAPAVQAACDAAVLPAVKREGLPKVIIEAMAYGTVPIVTDSGGSPELIEDGISGLIVPPRDAFAIAGAVSYLYHHPERRNEMGRHARKRIQKDFRIEDTIERTLFLYRQLLAEHR